MRLMVVMVCALLQACASSKPVMLGAARAAIAPAEVKLYWGAPAAFEPIADLQASSHTAFRPGTQQAMDKVIEELKIEAAKLGANGLMLEGFSDAQTASVGTGLGSQSYAGNTAVGVSAGGAFGIFKKTGRARAIFVPPG
jgi:uncharacterized protein YbjQ (UPF0145 family)